MRNRSIKLSKKVAAIILTATMSLSLLAGCGTESNIKEASANTTVDNNKEQTNTSSGSGTVEKAETVYVTADANGNVESITVSDWLKNKENYTTVTDTTTLQNVVAIKGSDDYNQSGSDLEFTANGNDVYYRGDLPATTQLPVSVAITYTLDGKEISADELEGASGHLQMHVKYTNHSSYTATIDGKEKEIHVPFLATTMMLISSDAATNMEIENGKIVENGSKNVVIGYGFPGVNESFGLDDGGVFTDTVDFSADVTDFSPEMMMTFVTSEAFASSNLDEAVDVETVTESLQEVTDISIESLNDIHSIEDIESVVDKMKDSFKELGDGTEKLKDGANELRDGANDLDQGANDIKDGANELKKGAAELNSGLKEYNSKFKLLSDGIVSAKDGGATLASKMKEAASAGATLAAGAKQVSSGVDTLNTSLNGMYSLIEKTIAENEATMAKLKQALAATEPGSSAYMTYYEQLNQLGGANQALSTIKGQMDKAKLKENLAVLAAGAKQVSDGNATLSAGLSQLSAGTSDLLKGLKDLQSGSKQLSAGSAALAKGSVQLADGTVTLYDGTISLTDGTKKLADGAKELADGAKELYDGTSKLTDAFDGNLTPLVDTTKALKEAAQAYNTFTAIPSNTNGHVSFVIRTE